MKKLAKILVLVLSVALLVGALLIVASATEEDIYTWTEEKVIKVYHTESADKYQADKADGVFDQFDAEFNVLTDAMEYAANHGATGKPAYVVLTDDFNEGKSVIDSTGAVYKGTLALGGKVVTLDLNGYDLNMTVGRILRSSGNGDVSSQRFQANGAADITIVGNGGTLRTCANLFQYNSGGGNVTFDGGNGGLNIVAAKMYSYNFVKDTYELYSGTGEKFNGTEGIVKGFAGNYGKGTSNNVNLLGDVTFTRENKQCTSFVCMYHTVGGFNINIGKADADATKRDTATFTVVEGSSESYNYRVFMHRDDQRKANGQDVLLGYALKGTVSINNATLNVSDSKLFDVFNKNFNNATDVDIITYNVKNSTLNLDGAKGAARNGFNLAGNGKVPYRITVESSEIYDDTTCFTGGDTTGNALIQIKNSYVSVVNPADGTPTTFSQRVGTIIAENCYFNIGYFTNLGIYWKDYDANDTDTAWPSYAASVGGYGAYAKDGNYFTNTSAKGNTSRAKQSPGVYTGAGQASNKLGSKGITNFGTYFIDGKAWYKIDNTTHYSTSYVGPYTLDGTAGHSVQDYSAAFTTRFAGLVLCIGNSNTTSRPGKFSIAKNPVLDDANTYVVHTYHEGTEGVNYSHVQPYIYFTPNNGFTIKTTDGEITRTAATYKINDYAFYTLDFDLMTREDKFTKDFNPQFFFRSYTDNGSIQGGAYIIMNENGVWRSPVTDETYAMDYTPGVWQHITMVLEMPIGADGSVDYLKAYADAKIHLCIDGKPVATFGGVLNAEGFADPSKYQDGGKYAGLSEIRISYNGTDQKGLDNAELATDSVSFARYDTLTTATVGEMAANVYSLYGDMRIEQPKDVPFSTYKLNGEYVPADQNFLAEYIVYAMFGTVYEEYALHTAAKGVVDLDELAKAAGAGESFAEIVEMLGGSFSFSIKTNGYKLTFSENPYVEEYDEATKILTVRSALPEDYVKVYFDDLNPETENAYIEVLPNKTVSADKFAAALDATYEAPYAKLVVNGWATTKYGTALTELEIGKEDITLYPAVEAVADFPVIYVNVFASDIIAFRFYVPAELIDDMQNDTIPNFVVKSGARYSYNGGENVSTGISVVSNYTKYEIGGKTYYTRDLWPGVGNFTLDTQYIIDYTVTYDGVEFDLSATYAISALEYSEYVLDAPKDEYNQAEIDVAANYLRYGYEYLNALAVIDGGEDYAERAAALKAAYDKYVEAGVKFSEYEADLLTDKANTNASDLAQYAEISVSVNSNRLQLVITPTGDTKLKGISVTTIGWVTDGIYANASKLVGTNVENKINLEDDATNNDFYTKDYVFKTQNIAPYNTFGVFTIVFTLEDDTQVSGTVSVEDYYNGLVAMGAENTEVYANLFYAIKELGDAFVANRFEER